MVGIFRNNAQMSSQGIVQIAAVMGSCVAGGAYLPIMSDEAIIVNKTGSIFLAGSYLVKAAIGEDIDNETLGGATTHCQISGVTDYQCENDQDALDVIKNLVDKIADTPKAGFSRVASVAPKLNPNDIYGILPISRTQPYDMKELILRIVDKFRMGRIQRGVWADNPYRLCTYRRLGGRNCCQSAQGGQNPKRGDADRWRYLF